MNGCKDYYLKTNFFLEKDNDKLAKNRESARNSRKRKKIYLELLEHKVTNLSDNLEVYKQICEKTHELALSF
jgi:hypothetical protein